MAEAAISKKYVNFKSALERYDLSVNSLFSSRFRFRLRPTCSVAGEADEAPREWG